MIHLIISVNMLCPLPKHNANQDVSGNFGFNKIHKLSGKSNCLKYVFLLKYISSAFPALGSPALVSRILPRQLSSPSFPTPPPACPHALAPSRVCACGQCRPLLSRSGKEPPWAGHARDGTNPSRFARSLGKLINVLLIMNHK